MAAAPAGYEREGVAAADDLAGSEQGFVSWPFLGVSVGQLLCRHSLRLLWLFLRCGLGPRAALPTVDSCAWPIQAFAPGLLVGPPV